VWCMSHDADKLAVVFPGQGVGDADHYDLVADERPDLLDLVRKLTGEEDPFARMGDGTRFAQPAVYCASLAGYARLGCPHGDLYAGHSLGEVAALAAANAVDELDGLRIVVARGRLMDAAAATAPEGGMLAVGGDREQAMELAERCNLALANENSPNQFVLTGPDAGLDAAEEGARDLDVRAKRLAVAGAFHSPAMAAAVEPFREYLDAIEFRPPSGPVISCVSAEPFESDPRELLAAALTRPVRWTDVLHRLHEEGARRFLDVGPGRVLAGLVRRTLDDVETESAREAEVAHA
jgi:[acyl-carrier-protein] S-malonyltransferase